LGTVISAGGNNSNNTNINNNYNIVTSDADSFRSSQSQILSEQNRVQESSMRRNRGIMGGSR
jgi:hypothetical protein